MRYVRYNNQLIDLQSDKWPTEVHVLDDSCWLGNTPEIEIDGYPTKMLNWPGWEFNKHTHTPSQVYWGEAPKPIELTYWWLLWGNTFSAMRFQRRMFTKGYVGFHSGWSKLVYNVTWTRLGYTEGQDPQTLSFASKYPLSNITTSK